MSRTLKSTVAGLALIAALGSAAVAQTAPTQPTAPQPGATQPEAQPPAPGAPDRALPPPPPPAEPVVVTEDTLPDVLKALDLQNIDIDRERRGSEVEGTLPDGTDIEAKLDARGALREISGDDDAALPASVIEALVPQAVRAADLFAEFAEIDEIEMAPEDGPVQDMKISGRDGQGEKLRATFAEDGSLMRFGRGDDDDRGKRGPKHRGKHGPDHDHRDARRGDDGPRGEDGRRGGPRWQDMRMEAGRADRPAPATDAPQAAAPAAAMTVLTDAGYTDLGNVRQDGPRVMVDATNAAGEPVTVELGPRGDVVRETAR
ncbi:hypothetical protein MLD63_04780 [Paracoccus sp. TK19116]|uniref:Uncharacterized protein n=1 Tax=Paracoccus albicereus TaxID=2922394 RepID=A0ABT1MQE9_9RHOB|nr:hypothetical protein [Paracoccus albicereus]MCQ0969741.1 hypothetical protein [Paracoccus albicereus]